MLGGGVRFASPPRLHHEVSDAGDRVLYAARLYHAGAAPVILVSGGRSKWSGPIIGSGAEAMSDILQLAGVPESAIILEIESTNTYENSVKTAEILESMDINQIILVTSAFHMPRSLKIFEKYQLTITPAPTNFHVIDQDWVYMTQLDPRIQLMNLIPTASNLKNTTLALKEYVGIFVYRLRGWL